VSILPLAIVSINSDLTLIRSLVFGQIYAVSITIRIVVS
jgi:hypothetical protein